VTLPCTIVSVFILTTAVLYRTANFEEESQNSKPINNIYVRISDDTGISCNKITDFSSQRHMCSLFQALAEGSVDSSR